MSITKEELKQINKEERRKKALGEAMSLLIVIVCTIWCCISQNVNADEACSLSYLVNNEMPSIPVKFDNEDHAKNVYSEMNHYIKLAKEYISCGDEDFFIGQLKSEISRASLKYYQAMNRTN